jgi:hypothetical protein
MENEKQKRKPEDRRILHVQKLICVDKYIEFPTPEKAAQALADIANGSIFGRSLMHAPQTVRLRGHKASLLERIPAGWKPDEEF